MTPPLIAAATMLVGTIAARRALGASRTWIALLAVTVAGGVVVGLAAARPGTAWGWALGALVGVSAGLAFTRGAGARASDRSLER